MRISITAACCRSWCARAFAAGSWRRAAPSICAPTCCPTPAASRNPKSRRSTGAMPRAGAPQVTPIYTQGRRRRLARCLPAGRIRELVRGHAGRARALLERRPSARLGLDRARVRRRRRSPASRCGCSPPAISAPTPSCCSPIPEAPTGFDYVISESTYGDERPAADHAASRGASISPPRFATRTPPTARCSFRPSRSSAPRS